MGSPHTPVNLALCAIYTRQQDWSKALNLYDQILLNAHSKPEILAMRAECYLHLKQYANAIADCSKALEVIKAPPQASLLYANRGYAQMHLNKPTQALADFNEAVKLNPGKVELSARGDALLKNHQYEPALKDFARVIELDKSNYHAFVASGICSAALHRDDKALDFFNEALTIDRSGIEALIERGALHLRRQNWQQAFNDLNQADQLNPGDALVLKQLDVARAHRPQ